MAVDEHSRHQLYQKLQEVLGEEDATTLMEHLPTGGASQLATKDDLLALRAALERRIDDLDHKADAIEHRLLTEIHRTARNLTFSLTSIIVVLNGIIFTALRLS
jgi:hypothetical protein